MHCEKDAARSSTGEAPLPGERLQKILAQAGIASRRKAEEIILEGRVQVNGTVGDGTWDACRSCDKDHISVWTASCCRARSSRSYYMLNKPRGYVTTLDDPQHRPTVMELMKTRSPGRMGIRCACTRWGGSTTSVKVCC